ncbi:uncharacterized protein LOC130357033 [Hyla sarda]|uniref:uncharacterized protein LOC130357033 n=1 Tax=Hyla sarda TaxID=327740 RepID=UPI0024C39EAE|nr:uncharacterized protein LOC130357033 [Hyla sarda]
MQLTLFGRQVDVMLKSRLESVDSAEHDLATLEEKKKNEKGDDSSSSAPSTAKVPLTSELEDMLMKQQDESTVHQNRMLKPIQKVHELLRDHGREIKDNQKQHCHILRHGFQRIEKKMDSMTNALSKVHKSILSLSQGMLALARQTATMNAELVKTNNQIVSTFQRLVQLKELELSKNPSQSSTPTEPSNSNSSAMSRRYRTRGGRRLYT